MATGYKSGGRDFSPGDERINRAGRPPTLPELRELPRLDKDSLNRILTLYLKMDRGQLKSALKDDETPMMEIAIASILSKAAANGDASRFEALLRRVVGEPPKSIELTGANGSDLFPVDEDKMKQYAINILKEEAGAEDE